MNTGVIFLAGIHGVGKGSLAGFLGERLELPRYSASSLIKAEKNKPVDLSKYVLEPELNQDFLVKSVRSLDVDKKLIILDGHCVLLNQDGFFDVPISTFQALPIVTIILKTLNADVIHQRLILRDNEAPELEVLEELQNREIKKANEIASMLDVKLLLVDGDNYEDVDFRLELNLVDL